MHAPKRRSGCSAQRSAIHRLYAREQRSAQLDVGDAQQRHARRSDTTAPARRRRSPSRRAARARGRRRARSTRPTNRRARRRSPAACVRRGPGRRGARSGTGPRRRTPTTRRRRAARGAALVRAATARVYSVHIHGGSMTCASASNQPRRSRWLVIGRRRDRASPAVRATWCTGARRRRPPSDPTRTMRSPTRGTRPHRPSRRVSRPVRAAPSWQWRGGVRR